MLKFPHEIKPLDEALNQQLMKDFHGERTGFVQVGNEKWLLPAAYAKYAELYYNTKLRKDDLWVVTFPRSGTTLCQELCWLVNNGFDYDTASKKSLQDRFPFLEVNCLLHDDFIKDLIDLNNNPETTQMLESWKTPGTVILDAMPETAPRHIKTHLPFPLLHPDLLSTCKAIYVARNPKDVAVSYYHHNRLVNLHGYVNDFQQYWKYFKDDLLVFSPFWAHIEDAWARRNSPNLLFLYYEDLVVDIKTAIKKVAAFLNKDITEAQIDKLADHLQIDNFRKNVPILTNAPIEGFSNDNAEGFIRKGKVGGNKEMDEEMTREADNWIKQNLERNGMKPFHH